MLRVHVLVGVRKAVDIQASCMMMTKSRQEMRRNKYSGKSDLGTILVRDGTEFQQLLGR